ncbi:hypothetical protein [Halobellus marinus]|uniref:hypothetical protein n=1 Tax=Halobellus TaxID=1073986 RepID=UPI0028AD89A4|nr:hypothetical protein [Halobellus sp. DFY28]
MTQDAVTEEWRQRPADPESNQDLGYHLDDWERIRARDADEEKYLYLPEDEELLRQEAFIIVPPDGVCDLDDHR